LQSFVKGCIVTVPPATERNTMTALLAALALLAPPPEGTWSPDGMVCRPDATPACRYVAPDCQLVRVMDAEPNLTGTRYELWCRPPRNAA
jgi:hypothetical protein